MTGGGGGAGVGGGGVGVAGGDGGGAAARPPQALPLPSPPPPPTHHSGGAPLDPGWELSCAGPALAPPGCSLQRAGAGACAGGRCRLGGSGAAAGPRGRAGVLRWLGVRDRAARPCLHPPPPSISHLAGAPHQTPRGERPPASACSRYLLASSRACAPPPAAERACRCRCASGWGLEGGGSSAAAAAGHARARRSRCEKAGAGPSPPAHPPTSGA